MNFYGRKLPWPGRIAGYGWLVSELMLREFLEQGNSELSSRALRKEFPALTQKEVALIEKAYEVAWSPA